MSDRKKALSSAEPVALAPTAVQDADLAAIRGLSEGQTTTILLLDARSVWDSGGAAGSLRASVTRGMLDDRFSMHLESYDGGDMWTPLGEATEAKELLAWEYLDLHGVSTFLAFLRMVADRHRTQIEIRNEADPAPDPDLRLAA